MKFPVGLPDRFVTAELIEVASGDFRILRRYARLAFVQVRENRVLARG